MNYEVMEYFRLRTSTGEYELFTGQIIKLPEDVARELLHTGKIRPQQPHYEPSTEKPVWVNPYPQGTPAARKHTLEVTMDAMLEQAVIDFQKIGYRNTPEAQEAETDVKNLYFMVLDGMKDITDFQTAISKWKLIACNQNGGI